MKKRASVLTVVLTRRSTKMDIPDIVGKTYTFEDGARCEVKQIKVRDDGPWVTYHVHGKSIPRKMTMLLSEFVNQYGHLFDLREPPKYR